MTIDPLAARLKDLIAEGSVISSVISTTMRRRLEPLFYAGALEERKSGGGRRVVARDREAIARWVRANYPSGLDGTGEELPPRAEAVANFRDSKAGKQLTSFPVFMRGFGKAVLSSSSRKLPLAAITAANDLAGVLVDNTDPWTVEGTLALVENFELFMHVESVVRGVDAALWTSGRASQRQFKWVASMPRVNVLHVGDYDPVGLDEYLRIRALMPDGRAALFVPDDFEKRLAIYGKVDLLVKSVAVLERVRREAPEDVRRVLAVMDRHGKGLEQESLLIPITAARETVRQG